MKKSEVKAHPLTRDEILNAKETPKTIVLPSGAKVKVGFLAFFLVCEIRTSAEEGGEEEKEHLFAEKVIRWMLRGNPKKELGSFTDEDQRHLIEIAAEEWGCKGEYDELPEHLLPEQRFYRAVCVHERRIAAQLLDMTRQLTGNLAASLAPLRGWQDELLSSMAVRFDQTALVQQVRDTFEGVSLRVFDQARETASLTVPIFNLMKSLEPLNVTLASPIGKLLETTKRNLLIYQDLMTGLVPIEKFSSQPETIRSRPTLEMRNTAVVVGRLFLEDNDGFENERVIAPDTNEVLTWLGSLDDNFPNTLEGAEQAIYSQNPERCRHFASSHRELATHVLHSLAPDDEVKAWTKDPNHFNKEGHPTRRARLLYIARNTRNGSFVEFVVSIFGNQIDLLNAVEHGMGHKFTDDVLFQLHLQFQSMLAFLMLIERWNSGD